MKFTQFMYYFGGEITYKHLYHVDSTVVSVSVSLLASNTINAAT